VIIAIPIEIPFYYNKNSVLVTIFFNPRAYTVTRFESKHYKYAIII